MTRPTFVSCDCTLVRGPYHICTGPLLRSLPLRGGRVKVLRAGASTKNVRDGITVLVSLPTIAMGFGVVNDNCETNCMRKMEV